MAVLAPIPSARDRTATRLKTGDFRKLRMANKTSADNLDIDGLDPYTAGARKSYEGKETGGGAETGHNSFRPSGGKEFDRHLRLQLADSRTILALALSHTERKAYANNIPESDSVVSDRFLDTGIPGSG